MVVGPQAIKVRGIYSDADGVGLLPVETARHGTGGHGRAGANLIDASGWRSIPHSRFASARDCIGALCGVAVHNPLMCTAITIDSTSVIALGTRTVAQCSGGGRDLLCPA